MTTSFVISGACLSALISASVGGDTDAEGMLFGSICTRRARHVNDDDEPSFRSETTVAIQSFMHTGPPLSFYGATGAIDRSRIAAVVASRPPGTALLGWYMYRRGAALRPSAREAAVQRELEALLREGERAGPVSGSRKSPRTGAGDAGADREPPPVPVFLLLGASAFVRCAVHQFDFVMFRRHPVFRTLSAARLNVSSLVNVAAKEEFAPTTPLSPLPPSSCSSSPASASAPSSSAPGSLGSVLRLEGLAGAAGPFPPHVLELERLFRDALGGAAQLAAKARPPPAPASPPPRPLAASPDRPRRQVARAERELEEARARGGRSARRASRRERSRSSEGRAAGPGPGPGSADAAPPEEDLLQL
eukprot:tig00020941_g16233.t1